MKTLTLDEIERRARKGMPKAVIAFALRHKISVGRTWDQWGGYYYVLCPVRGVVEVTRTAHPKACHALAMMRRYLSGGVSGVAA